MACMLGIEESCTECRMCRIKEAERANENAQHETAIVQQSNQEQRQNWDIPGQISIEEYLQNLK